MPSHHTGIIEWSTAIKTMSCPFTASSILSTIVKFSDSGINIITNNIWDLGRPSRAGLVLTYLLRWIRLGPFSSPVCYVELTTYFIYHNKFCRLNCSLCKSLPVVLGSYLLVGFSYIIKEYFSIVFEFACTLSLNGIM